jgi:hypothetical protein
MCSESYTPTFGTNGALQSCNKTVSSVNIAADNATVVSGTWAVMYVLANDAGTARRIESVSKPMQGGKAVVVVNTTGAYAGR